MRAHIGNIVSGVFTPGAVRKPLNLLAGNSESGKVPTNQGLTPESADQERETRLGPANSRVVGKQEVEIC